MSENGLCRPKWPCYEGEWEYNHWIQGYLVLVMFRQTPNFPWLGWRNMKKPIPLESFAFWGPKGFPVPFCCLRSSQWYAGNLSPNFGIERNRVAQFLLPKNMKEELATETCLLMAVYDWLNIDWLYHTFGYIWWFPTSSTAPSAVAEVAD